MNGNHRKGRERLNRLVRRCRPLSIRSKALPEAEAPAKPFGRRAAHRRPSLPMPAAEELMLPELMAAPT